MAVLRLMARDRVGQPAVDVEQLGRLPPLLRVEAGVGEGDAGLLGQHVEHELLGRRRLVGSGDGEEAEVAAEAAQREGPPPSFRRRQRWRRQRC